MLWLFPVYLTLPVVFVREHRVCGASGNTMFWLRPIYLSYFCPTYQLSHLCFSDLGGQEVGPQAVGYCRCRD